MATDRRELLALSGAVLAGLGGCIAAPGTDVGEGGVSDPEHSTTADVGGQRVDPDVSDAQIQSLARGNTAFALDLYGRLVGAEPARDHFVSPLSVSMALAMTWAGARGDTEAAMAETLHFPFGQADLHPAFNGLARALEGRGATSGEDGDPFELHVADALWPRAGLELGDGFVDTLADHYGARPVPLDFADDPESARRTINGWVADETADRIDELIPQGGLRGNPPLVLTNAVYFLAGWLKTFDEGDTRDATFTALDGTAGDVAMMSQTESFPHAAVDGHQLVELPYVGGQTSMVVLLPAEGEFESFESSLGVDRLDALLAELSERSGTIELPRFGVETSYRLSDALRAMGMAEAFGREANFGGMVDGGDISIAQVYHDAFVAVDEAGTEAAAATAVTMADGGASSEFEVTVDRPFLFLIRDRPTGSVLFLGRVVEVPEGP